MENFKVNENFKDYAAIQRHYFSDLKLDEKQIEAIYDYLCKGHIKVVGYTNMTPDDTTADEMKIDAIASLFVVIEQVFGRLCRLGSTMKEKYPTIYWVDGAFNAPEEGKFDTLRELEHYLENLMEQGPNPLVAKTLYEPFYKALKGKRYDEQK